MTVLGRRAPPRLPPGESEPERLFLARVDLREAGLKKANLRRVDLREAHLQDAHLEEADLREAQLEGAHLRDLEGTHLPDAHLEGTVLHRASADKKTEWPECFDPRRTESMWRTMSRRAGRRAHECRSPMHHVEWQPGQAEIAAAGGADLRHAKNAASPLN
jgi:uncharacterized protein YjbI with pentapeptide repeats